MQPDLRKLLATAGIELPLIGLYDAPETEPFEPLVSPAEGRWACPFMYYKRWLKGDTLHLVRSNYGCGGAGTYLFDQKTRSREDYIDFLHGEEGLKADREIMGRWIDDSPHFKPAHGHLMIGPLKSDQYDCLKTVTFLVNPDQLSLLLTGAHYRHAPGDPSPVIAPFASGCGLLAPMLVDLETPRATIGATDIAMRKYLPPDILAFTVTRAMLEQLSTLDDASFLGKPFWQALRKARGR